MEHVELEFTGPNGKTRRLSLDRGRHIVGRGQDADLRLPLNSVSRAHCEVILDEDGLRVRDLGSLNGTFRNGRRVEQEVPLAGGDTLVLGEVTISVRAGEGEATPADDAHQQADAGESSMMDGTSVQASGDQTVARASRPSGDDDDFDFDFDFDESKG